MGAASLRQSLAKLVLRVFHHLSDNCVDRTGRGIFDFVNTIKTNIQGIKNQLWYQIVRMNAALMLLLLPLAQCAPPMHSHAPPPPCDTTTCRVSDQSLNSALSTFLCFTTEETSAMEEKDKKKELAAAISPFLEGVREAELVAMDSQAMVSLVNLVLHEGSSKAVKKTRKLHLEDLVKSVARASNLNMKPKFYKNADPILLALLNCQSKTIVEIHELVEPMAGGDRTGRGIFDFVNAIKTKIQGIKNKIPVVNMLPTDKIMNPINAAKASIQEMKNTIPGLNKLPLNKAMPGADKLPGADQKQALPGANDKLAIANLPGNLLGMAGEDKINIQTKKELLLSLEAINGLVNLMQMKVTTAAPGTTAAPSSTTAAPSSTTAAPATTAIAATTTASTATTSASTGTTAAGSATTTASSKISDPMQQVMAMIRQLQQKINKL